MPVPALDRITADDVLPEAVDVAIVGAGIVGVTTALFLAERGHSVLVCEKGVVAGEQSSRNWGFVRKMGRDPAELPLAIESLSLWRRLDAIYGIRTGFRETGILFVGRAAAKAAEFDRWAGIARDHDLTTARLGRDGVARLVPGLNDGFDTGLHTPDDGRAEPAMAVPALASAARARGATILEGCAVEGVERSAGRVSALVTERGTVRCDAVVVAAGIWSRRLLTPLEIDLPQLPVIGSVARVEGVRALPPMPVAAEHFAWRRREDGGATLALRGANVSPVTWDALRLMPDFLPTYLKTWRELKLRPPGACPAALRAPASDAGAFARARMLDPAPAGASLARAHRMLAEAIPGAGEARVTHRWGGVIDATPDALPVIDRTPARGLHVATGFSGHGFGIGPGAGRLMAQIIVGETPCVDPAPFRLDRFRRRRAPSGRAAAA